MTPRTLYSQAGRTLRPEDSWWEVRGVHWCPMTPTPGRKGQALLLLNPREGRVSTTAESFRKRNEHVLQEMPFPFLPKSSNH